MTPSKSSTHVQLAEKAQAIVELRRQIHSGRFTPAEVEMFRDTDRRLTEQLARLAQL